MQNTGCTLRASANLIRTFHKNNVHYAELSVNETNLNGELIPKLYIVKILDELIDILHGVHLDHEIMSRDLVVEKIGLVLKQELLNVTISNPLISKNGLYGTLCSAIPLSYLGKDYLKSTLFGFGSITNLKQVKDNIYVGLELSRGPKGVNSSIIRMNTPLSVDLKLSWLDTLAIEDLDWESGGHYYDQLIGVQMQFSIKNFHSERNGNFMNAKGVLAKMTDPIFAGCYNRKDRLEAMAAA